MFFMTIVRETILTFFYSYIHGYLKPKILENTRI